MEMPKPIPQHRKLEAFAGTWTGQEKMLPSPWDPKGGNAQGAITSRMDLDGMYLVSDYTQQRDGKVTYRGHGVIGYDPKREAYTMYWFDSMSYDTGGAALGRWESDTLTFEMKNPMGYSRYIYKLQGDGKYEFRMEMSQDGRNFQPWLESTWTRKK